MREWGNQSILQLLLIDQLFLFFFWFEFSLANRTTTFSPSQFIETLFVEVTFAFAFFNNFVFFVHFSVANMAVILHIFLYFAVYSASERFDQTIIHFQNRIFFQLILFFVKLHKLFVSGYFHEEEPYMFAYVLLRPEIEATALNDFVELNNN